MPNPRVLKAHGISSGEYKKLFTMPVKPPRVQKLIDLITNRIKDGYNRNLADWKTYAAIDLAQDAVFNQSTATFVRHLMSRKFDNAEMMLAEVEKWGLKESDLFLTVKQDGSEVKKINEPVFYRLLIPLCRSYCTARIASLYNERNTSPLLSYKPLKKTARNRVICEIVTDIVNKISNDYGYPSYLDQAIRQTVKYGVALSFPKEEWDCQEQIEEDDESKSGFKTVTVKEGLRYNFPHPTRMFYDLYNPLTTINSDTGCEFLAYWEVIPFSDILDNRDYWNRKTISYGTNWFASTLAGNYFNEFYPCRLKFPVLGEFEAKREDKAAFYSSSDRDKAVFQTVMFMKLRPRDWDLGKYEDGKLVKTYDHYVWHRFYVAGDSTIIWAEPCAYTPSWFMGYDYDAQSGRQSSLGLETIPWQDLLGNIITQMLLTVKQNLANVTWYDSNMVNKSDVDELKNLGEGFYRGMNFLKYDSMKTSRAGFNPKDAFLPVQLNYRSIQDQVQMMGTILNIMERVLQFTAQEVGATASHYQSAEEIKTVNQSSDQKTNYTGASIDAGIDAWKVQLYMASRAYLDPDFESEVSADIPEVDKVLAELGFEVTGKSKDKIFVKGKKSKLELDQFARHGGDHEPETDQQTAQALFSVIGIIASHPEIFQPIGVKRIISLLEQAAKFAGADKDFKLGTDAAKPEQPQPVHPDTGHPMPPGAQQVQPPQATPPAPPAQQAQQPNPGDVHSLVGQAVQMALQMVEEKIAKPAAAEMVKQEQQIQQLAQVVQKLESMLGLIKPPQPQPTAQ